MIPGFADIPGVLLVPELEGNLTHDELVSAFNEDLATDGLQQLTLGEYLMSSDFAVDVTENWHSEFPFSLGTGRPQHPGRWSPHASFVR